MHENLKKIVAGYSIVALLTGTGCSKPEEPEIRRVGQEKAEQHKFPGDEGQGNNIQQTEVDSQDLEKQTLQPGKEVKIRGKSG